MNIAVVVVVLGCRIIALANAIVIVFVMKITSIGKHAYCLLMSKLRRITTVVLLPTEHLNPLPQ